jgi:hypothetical protein
MEFFNFFRILTSTVSASKYRAVAGMKKLLFSFLLLGLLRATAWCDMLKNHSLFFPRPETTITNLKAFPGFKFSYYAEKIPIIVPSQDTPSEKQAKVIVPLQDMQVLFFGEPYNVHFFVEDSSGERFQWASLPFDGLTKTKAISILDVHRDGETIQVSYETQRYPASADPASAVESTNHGVSVVALLILSGASLGALVLLVRRKRAASTGR